VTGPLQGHYLHRTTYRRKENMSIIRVGFEPTIPMFSWAKTFYALDGGATVIGSILLLFFWNVFPLNTSIHFVCGIVIVNCFKNIHIRAELLTMCWAGLGFLCSPEFVCRSHFTLVKCYSIKHNTDTVINIPRQLFLTKYVFISTRSHFPNVAFVWFFVLQNEVTW
jgi:hypothetical protein